MRAVGDVSTAFEEDPAAPIARGIGMAAFWCRRGGFVDNVQATLEADKVMPLQAVLCRDLRERFGTLARATHKLFLRGRRMTYSTIHFEADKLKFGPRRERWGEDF